MTDDTYYLRGPATVCNPTGFFFDRVVREIVGPIERPFRVFGVTYDYDLAEATVDYEHPPTGPRTSTWPEQVISYAVDRALVVEAIARTACAYSRRVNRETGRTLPPSAGWAAELRRYFPRWFDLEFECDVGWADLIQAMAEWVHEIGVPPRFKFSQVKEKLAGLRAYSCGLGMSHAQIIRVRGVIAACETVSYGICGQYGEPGTVRKTAQGYYYTACDKHA
ncbi:hypothetical protein [Microvirga sp. G4-2]|uniref:hypothetical protein n=1 Tax=Microvirga sp. G4-2 TaxID=3434467 RepID=UPI004043F14A